MKTSKHNNKIPAAQQKMVLQTFTKKFMKGIVPAQISTNKYYCTFYTFIIIYCTEVAVDNVNNTLMIWYLAYKL